MEKSSGISPGQDAAAQQIRSNAPTPISGDTFTGQMAHLDELINIARVVLERTHKHAEALAPGTDAPESTLGKVGRIETHPDAGPLIFRMQNRTSEIDRLLRQICQAQNRIDQVL